MLKITLIIIALITLTACGDVPDYGRAAADNEPVVIGDSIADACDLDALVRAVPGQGVHFVRDVTRHFQYSDGDAVYMILAGLNNLWLYEPYHYEHVMRMALDNLEGKRVTLISILPVWRQTYTDEQNNLANQEIEKFNDVLEALAGEYGIGYHDIYDGMLLDGDINPLYYVEDGVHLTEAGCEKVFNN